LKKFYGVGVGPGDKELITLKAYNLIKNCDYVFVPKSRGDSLAKKIAEDFTQGKNIIELRFPMGEDNSERYKEAALKINETLQEEEIGVFLTIGDPMTYSTYIYLMKELIKLKIEVSTVPGITSFGAVASTLNLPITLKGEGFYLCDGELDEEILKKVDSVCVLKVNKVKEEILNKLERHNFKYVYVKKCTQQEEKILFDKEEILKDDDYMSLIFGRRA
jgi:precorrin-2/cobalt-factor-2 C20-methyltransferase